MFDRWGKALQDVNGSKSNFTVASTTATGDNVDGWIVAYEKDAINNVTALTLAKAAAGTAVNNSVVWVKEDSGKPAKALTFISVSNNSWMAKANALGKHPSTIT